MHRFTERVRPSALEAIGNTPLVGLSRLVRSGEGRFVAKLEHLNPGFSKKDRIARQIIEDAAASDPPQGSDAQKVGDFFKSLTNVELRNELGTKPVQPLLMQIAAIEDKQGLAKTAAALARKGIFGPFVGFIQPDLAGDLDITGNGLANMKSGGTLDINLPAVLQVGLSWTQAPFTVEFDYQWTQWSNYDMLQLNVDSTAMPLS